MKVRENVSLKVYNTMGIAVNSRYFAEVENASDLSVLWREERFAALPKFVLGGGSNTLFLGDFPGLTVRLCNRGVEVLEKTDSEILLRVQAGEVWKDFVSQTVDKGWWGVENLSGIPGSVGGAAVQNMGAYGVEICRYVQRLEVFDTQSLSFSEIPLAECGYGYRKSRFKGGERYIVWSVVLKLGLKPAPCLEYAGLQKRFADAERPSQREIAQAVLEMRGEKLPDVRETGSVGSFFTNPSVSAAKYASLKAQYPDIPGFVSAEGVKLSSAWLIDRCGWKGYSENGAGVYEKQPLVLVNRGGAGGEDIWNLALKIRRSVAEKFGVEIEAEVCPVNGSEKMREVRYPEIMERMFRALPMFHRVGAAAYKPGLETTIRMMEALGNPYRNFKSIHVAGTNGKGSCSHILASVFQAAGYKTGLYTSPHLRDFRERIRIDGKMIPKAAVVDFYEAHAGFFEENKTSFFEMTVGMAFDYFSREKVDIAVIEVGMGGKFDSTNVITPELSLITNISMDHMQFLGNTLVGIAGEKAGIIKPGVPVVISETQAEVREVFENRARECGAEITFADSCFALRNVRNDGVSYTFDVCRNGSLSMAGLSCDLYGDSYENKNIVGVLCALEKLRSRYNLSEGAVREGLASVSARTGLAGRWQRLGTHPLTYCDTGHNEAGIRLVLAQIAKIPYRKLHIVWGMVADKDIDHILPLLPSSAAYYFCKAPQERALDASRLKERAAGFGLRGEAYASVAEALAEARRAAAPDDLIYIGGSTFVVAEIC